MRRSVQFVFGVLAHRWSIAWHAALSLHREGARLAFSVFGEREENSVRKLLEANGIEAPLFQCNATDDAQVIDAYRGFGWSLGIAFQLNDDLLGIWGDEQATGKQPSDLAKHKKTLPIIYALENADPADSDALRAILRSDALGADGLAQARAILERSGAREYTRGKARDYRDEALARLEAAGIVNGEALERLRLIVVSAISA